MEVCSFSRELMLQILSISLQTGIRFLHYPLPAPSSAFLAVCLPYRRKYKAYPVPSIIQQWVRWLLYTGDLRTSRNEECHITFWSELISIFSSFVITILMKLHLRSPYH
ncbi:hypothetical protein TNIN_38101 [Trichonephila inaurata madagascariensis]|uniref:Uncharacterized protein n=1 Tax=Trichonephila inaurata madagascariensis TaxID=2747483 RepID=A0A8X6Y710_9ARAC|nr:hypothetical protein TNIN_38101 [Trichonephila inaurata madagascariensis]